MFPQTPHVESVVLMTRVALTRICEFYAEEDVVYCMEERRIISKGYTNLYFILLNVLKIKALRKIKNRIKIIIVLANRKARFFYFRCVIFDKNGVNKIIFGCVLILFDLFGFTFGCRKKHWI